MMPDIHYHKPIDELIRSRFSCRAYLKKKIEVNKIKELQEACATCKEGLAGEKARFRFLEFDEKNIGEMRPGDFSLIGNPMNFIAGAIRKSELVYESYGYLLEYIVIKATDLDLGTCWLGYFNPDFFKALQLTHNEILPAVCVLGYAAEMKDFSSRKPWGHLFFSGHFFTPLSREEAGSYAESLEMVRLAPSSGNTQPWVIIKEKKRHTFHFFKRIVDIHYEQKRLHNIDLGIALCHFELGAKKNNLSGLWQKVKPNISPIPPGTEYIITWTGM